MSFLTGRSKSESKNTAYPWLQQQFGGTSSQMINDANAGLGQVQNFLTGSDMSGFNQYRGSTGYQNIFDEAMRGVTSNAASRGLLASGATLRAQQDRAAQLAQQQYANYLQQLLGVSQARLQGGTNLANIISGAGQTSTSTSRPGLLGAIGSVASGVGSILGGGR